jgi:hypothetical protein
MLPLGGLTASVSASVALGQACSIVTVVNLPLWGSLGLASCLLLLDPLKLEVDLVFTDSAPTAHSVSETNCNPLFLFIAKIAENTVVV